MDELELRPARPEDHAAIIDLARQTFAGICLADQLHRQFGVPPYGDPSLAGEVGHGPAIAQRLRAHPDRFWVSVLNGRVVGYVSYGMDAQRGVGTIHSNGVAHDARGRGVGTAQVRRMVALFREHGMKHAAVATGLSPGFAPARRMYEKAGFQPVARNVRYFMPL